MAFIDCCGKKHKALVFELKTKEFDCVSKTLKSAYCPVCGKTIVLIEKKVFEKGVEKLKCVRRQGKEADLLFDKVEKDILCQVPERVNVFCQKGFFLRYNEYGKIKKCFTNLSSLRLGLLDFNIPSVRKQFG